MFTLTFLVRDERMLSLDLLGQFRLSDGTRAVGPLPRKAQALLAYLASHSSEAIPRERLATLLWSYSDPGHGRQSLRQALAAIRAGLGTAQDLLMIDAGSVRLAVGDALAVDVSSFEALARSADTAALERASALYRGEFLAGLHIGTEQFEEWLSIERPRLLRIACEVQRRLAMALAGAGRLDAAIEAARRLTQLDPLGENGHRLLIELLAAAGQRSTALAQYSLLNDRLRHELGVSPEPETVELVNAVRRGELPRTEPRPPRGAVLVGLMAADGHRRRVPAQDSTSARPSDAQSPPGSSSGNGAALLHHLQIEPARQHVSSTLDPVAGQASERVAVPVSRLRPASVRAPSPTSDVGQASGSGTLHDQSERLSGEPQKPADPVPAFVSVTSDSVRPWQTRLHASARRLGTLARLPGHLSRVSSVWGLLVLVGSCVVLATLIPGLAHRSDQRGTLRSTAEDKSPGSSFSIPVAILPFTTSTPDHAAGHAIAEQISDELRGYLSRFSLLGVVPGHAGPQIEVASSSLNDWSNARRRYVVSGSLETQDQTLRLRVDLIDEAKNLLIWSQTLDYTFAEWTLSQDFVARHLAYAVHVEATNREGIGLSDRVEELSTSQLLAGGWASMMGGTWGNLRHDHAAELFDEALRRDPQCTSAMVGLAGTKIMRASNLKGDRDQQMVEAEDLLRKAQLRGEADFSLYFYLGILHILQGNVSAALQDYDRVLEINPSFAPAHAYRGRALMALGRYGEALQNIEYADRLAGKAVVGWRLWQGMALLQLGQDNVAGEPLHTAIAVMPNNPYANAALASFYARNGQLEDARPHVERLRKRTPGKSDQWRLLEFSVGPMPQRLASPLGEGLRLALDALPGPQ